MKSEPMTLKQAADWLGIKGENRTQRLRRILLRFEAKTGKAILVRVGDGKRPTYLVTKAAIRTACPELIDHHDTILRGMRTAFGGAKSEIAALREAFDEMRSDLNVMREMLRRMGQRGAA